MIDDLSQLIRVLRSHEFLIHVDVTEPVFFAELIGTAKHLGYRVDLFEIRSQWLRLPPERRRYYISYFQSERSANDSTW